MIRLLDNASTHRQTKNPTVVAMNPIRPIVAKNLVAWSHPEEKLKNYKINMCNLSYLSIFSDFRTLFMLMKLNNYLL